jgi:hypothetical protein
MEYIELLKDKVKGLKKEIERQKEVASWVDRRKFLSAYWEVRNDYRFDIDCFCKLNDEYYKLTGKDRYDYDSFRTYKNNELKK